MSIDDHPAQRVRAASRLSALKVAKLKTAGLYEDGAGLRLVITDKGVKRWALRLTINGRRRERGLGVWPDVSLDSARSQASQMRAAAKGGRDLRREHRDAMLKAVTFEQAFAEFFAIRRQTLSNGKHVSQWQSTMATYVFPALGKRPIADITSAEVLAVLQPIWFAKPETAARILQRIKSAFDSAILRGTRERANPCTGVVAELGTGHRTVTHHAALPWQGVAQFMLELHACSATVATKLVFEFLILTAVRSGEARGALWQEIDLERRLWTIPGVDPVTGRRMKSRETHVVPLSNRAIVLLREARRLHDGALVFPGSKGQPLSDNTLSKLMREAGGHGTPHGFRSTFKDWAAETGVRDEVSEAALAHTDRNKVRAAYRRTNYLEERTAVMREWAIIVAAKP